MPCLRYLRHLPTWDIGRLLTRPRPRLHIHLYLQTLTVFKPAATYTMSSTKRKSEGLTSGDANKKPKVNASITSFFGAPKSSPTSSPAKFGAGPEPAPLKFDKDKWVAGLTPEQKRHLQLEIQTLDPSWLVHLREEITSPEFIELKKFLESEVKANKKVFPPREDVYSWYVDVASRLLALYLPPSWNATYSIHRLELTSSSGLATHPSTQSSA